MWPGAVAGAVSAVSFAAIHYVLISDIWDMAVIMAVAGALSGVCLAWTYRRLDARASVNGWLRYNLTYIGLFAVIPALSVALFDPIITFAEASESDGPLDELIVEALPMTVIAVLAIAVVVSLLFGSLRHDYGPILIAVTVLMLFLGLNLTIIGLVEFTVGRTRLVAGFIGLIVAIGFVFSVTYAALERRRLLASPVTGA